MPIANPDPAEGLNEKWLVWQKFNATGWIQPGEVQSGSIQFNSLGNQSPPSAVVSMGDVPGLLEPKQLPQFWKFWPKSSRTEGTEGNSLAFCLLNTTTFAQRNSGRRARQNTSYRKLLRRERKDHSCTRAKKESHVVSGLFDIGRCSVCKII